MTVQAYVQKYFGVSAEDYAAFVTQMRLGDYDAVCACEAGKVMPEALGRLLPLPDAKTIFRSLRAQWRAEMRWIDSHGFGLVV